MRVLRFKGSLPSGINAFYRLIEIPMKSLTVGRQRRPIDPNYFHRLREKAFERVEIFSDPRKTGTLFQRCSLRALLSFLSFRLNRIASYEGTKRA